MSTSSVARSRLLMPMMSALDLHARPRARSASWTSTSVASPSCVGERVQADQRAGLERRDDQQDRVGAAGQRLVHLVLLDDEVLAQDRQARRRRARRARSASAPPKRLSSVSTDSAAAPRALVGADDVGQLEVGADHAGRRRAALVLGDHREPGRAPARRGTARNRRSDRRAAARRPRSALAAGRAAARRATATRVSATISVSTSLMRVDSLWRELAG